MHYNSVTGTIKCNPLSAVAASWQRSDIILKALAAHINSQPVPEASSDTRMASKRSIHSMNYEASKRAWKGANASDDSDDDIIAHGFLFGTGTVKSSTQINLKHSHNQPVFQMPSACGQMIQPTSTLCPSNATTTSLRANNFKISIEELMDQAQLRREEVTKGLYYLQNRGALSYQLTDPCMFITWNPSTALTSRNNQTSNINGMGNDTTRQETTMSFVDRRSYHDWLHSLATRLCEVLRQHETSSAERALLMWTLGSVITVPADELHTATNVAAKEQVTVNLFIQQYFASNRTSDAVSTAAELGLVNTAAGGPMCPVYVACETFNESKERNSPEMPVLSKHRIQQLRQEIQALVRHPTIHAIVTQLVSLCTKRSVCSDDNGSSPGLLLSSPPPVKLVQAADIIDALSTYVVKCLHGVSSPSITWNDWKENSAWGKYK
jgi:hypothetical protein